MARSTVIRGEPDRSTSTLAEWMAYRDYLLSLPQDDDAVRLALALTRSRIRRLRAREGGTREGGRE